MAEFNIEAILDNYSVLDSSELQNCTQELLDVVVSGHIRAEDAANALARVRLKHHELEMLNNRLHALNDGRVFLAILAVISQYQPLSREIIVSLENKLRSPSVEQLRHLATIAWHNRLPESSQLVRWVLDYVSQDDSEPGACLFMLYLLTKYMNKQQLIQYAQRVKRQVVGDRLYSAAIDKLLNDTRIRWADPDAGASPEQN